MQGREGGIEGGSGKVGRYMERGRVGSKREGKGRGKAGGGRGRGRGREGEGGRGGDRGREREEREREEGKEREDHVFIIWPRLQPTSIYHHTSIYQHQYKPAVSSTMMHKIERELLTLHPTWHSQVFRRIL